MLWIKLTEIGGSPTATADPEHPSRAVSENRLPPVNSHSHRSIVPVLVGGGLVAAGAAVGVVFLISANSSQKDADQIRASLPGANACGAGTPYVSECAELQDKHSDIDRARTLEIVGFSVAGAAAVGTGVYLLWPRSHSSSRASVPSTLLPTVAITPGGFSHFGLSGRF